MSYAFTYINLRIEPSLNAERKEGHKVSLIIIHKYSVHTATHTHTLHTQRQGIPYPNIYIYIYLRFDTFRWIWFCKIVIYLFLFHFFISLLYADLFSVFFLSLYFIDWPILYRNADCQYLDEFHRQSLHTRWQCRIEWWWWHDIDSTSHQQHNVITFMID